MTDRSKKIMIRVTPETKADWQAKIEESQYSSLAGGIRAAMHSKFIADNDGRAAPAGDADVDLTPLQNQLDTVLERLDRLDERVEEIGPTPEEYDVPEMANIMEGSMMRTTDPDELPSLMESTKASDAQEEAAVIGTISAWADYFDTPEEDVEEALDMVAEEVDVGRVRESGVTRYFIDSDTRTFR